MDVMVLEHILVLLIVSVVGVALFKRIKLPAVLAYLFVGMVVGPFGLGWIPENNGTRLLAEFGVVFLLFTIGLEFSLPYLMAMKKEMLGLGGAQVVLTTAVTAIVAWALGMSLEAAIVLGGILAMSSTAIVTKQLSEKMELISRHGRSSVGILLFQDIAVVPFLIVIPLLGAGSDNSILAELSWALLKGVFVVAVMLSIGHWLLRPIFQRMASFHSAELFTLTALLFALAAAWSTHHFGLSLAFGAFLAGMMLGETEFKHQVEADIRPFRDVLLGLFFVTVGMLLDARVLLDILQWVILLSVAIILFKVLSITWLAALFGSPSGVALRTGIVMAQGGEFGLALLALALNAGLYASTESQIILASIIVTMAISPFLINNNGALAKRIFHASYTRNRNEIVEQIETSGRGLIDHVIICGYGRIGQNIGRLLDNEGFRYTALDLDPVIVREAREAGDPVNYGDSTRTEILEAAGLMQASVLVISYDDVHSALKIIEQVRLQRPDMPILVRTADDANLERLQQAGATEVIPETLEASLMLASHVLVLLQVPVTRILRHVQGVRKDRYRMLRGFFHGQESESIEQSEFRERMHSATLPEGAYAVGRKLIELGLDDLNVVVTAIRRGGIRGPHPDPEMTLSAGDTLVLYALPEDLARAEGRLLKG
jgi:CPA2 family monovalent cation:H+ antiporter-2